MLFCGYINEATEFAQAQGGGDSELELPWRRKEDEDDRRWAYRCLHQAQNDAATNPPHPPPLILNIQELSDIHSP